MIHYLIWDAGGTLFDTYPAVARACRAALHDFDADASLAWIMQLCRQTTAHGIRTLAATFNLDKATLRAHFGQHYDAIPAQDQPPFPGVEQICRYICDIGGQNFIVTHRERASLQMLLGAHKLAHYFTTCITGEDPYPRKPNPASIKTLILQHNLDRRQCLAIGDRDLDIAAGHNAGIHTCFFGSDSHSTPADIEIMVFTELQQWLLNKNNILARANR